MNRSMTTLLSRWYDISFLSDTISPLQRRTGNPSQGLGIKSACPTNPLATTPPSILRVACSFVGRALA